jgi:hypothetical protein
MSKISRDDADALNLKEIFSPAAEKYISVRNAFHVFAGMTLGALAQGTDIKFIKKTFLDNMSPHDWNKLRVDVQNNVESATFSQSTLFPADKKAVLNALDGLELILDTNHDMGKFYADVIETYKKTLHLEVP